VYLGIFEIVPIIFISGFRKFFKIRFIYVIITLLYNYNLIIYVYIFIHIISMTFSYGWLYFPDRVKWVPSQHGMTRPQVADGVDGLQI
jgi:hypothetical protein